MRKQPKRAPLLAYRNKNTLSKRAKLKKMAKVSNADNIVILNPRLINGGRSGFPEKVDRLHFKDSIVSSITSLSSATLDSHSSMETESRYSQNDQVSEIYEEQPLIITHFQSRNIIETMSALEVYFKDVSRDEHRNDSLLPLFLQDILSSFGFSNYINKDEQIIISNIQKANDCLRADDFLQAEKHYQEAIQSSTRSTNLVLIAHLFNAYGNFLSVCMNNNRKATIILSNALPFISASVRKKQLCRAVTLTNLGKVYIRRSLETGIKDEGMKNLNRADICFKLALDVYMKYDMTSQIENSLILMNYSEDFRSGVRRTMWNEAIANEASALYDEHTSYHHAHTDDDDSISNIGQEDFMDRCVFLHEDENNYSKTLCFDWTMLLPSIEKDDSGNASEQYLNVLQDQSNQRFQLG